MKRIAESWQAIRVVLLNSDPGSSYKDVLITSTILMSIQSTDSYFLYRDEMTFTGHSGAVGSLVTYYQSCILVNLTDPRSSYIVSISDYVPASDRAVVCIAGVVSVLSGSLLGSIPSMDVTCVACQPNVKFCRLSSKGPISFARRIKDAQQSCLLVDPGRPNTELQDTYHLCTLS